MKILKEFKTFAVKGNVIDLAVAVVIGASFGKIVTSLVEDIINPLIGLLAGNIDFSHKVLALSLPIEGTTQLVLRYGAFITTIINFTVVTFAIFMIVRQINKLKAKEDKKAEAAKTSEEVKVLREIKDLLAQK